MTLIELEDQTLNSDLVEVQIRFRTHTNAKYVIWDNARVTGHTVDDYVFPYTLTNGNIRQVWIQSTSEISDYPCDELYPRTGKGYGLDDYNDGTYDFIHIANAMQPNYKIKLVRYCPFTALSAPTDTLAITDPQSRALIAYAFTSSTRCREPNHRQKAGI